MDTLLLDNTLWDLLVDSAGNLARATNPYSRAQDVASALRTFIGECFYDTSLGVPYFQQVLGHLPPVPLLQSLLVEAALTVPGVVTATATLNALQDRALTGQVAFTDVDGVSGAISLSGAGGRLNVDFVLDQSSLG